ncbi:MAG: hypothetical protein KAI81_09605, partial [Candidatus Marinimicrobia bacterium]|nr:hypothetical protein [Candidatus Neomarinimicrobiota bacterium]
HKIEIDKTIKAELNYDISPDDHPANNPALASAEFDILTSKYTSDLSTKSSGIKNYPLFMIIAPDTFHNTLIDFITWKRQMGFYVEFLSYESLGESPLGVRIFLQERYDSDYFPEYLLLVGDHEQLPAWESGIPDDSPVDNSHITDLYYAAITKDDFLPDLLLGRFPARTPSELDNMINKTISYESLSSDNASYLTDAMLVAGYSSDNAHITYGLPTINYAQDNYLNSSHNYDKIWRLIGNYATSTELIAAINSGLSFINYTGHGSSTTWNNPPLNTSQISSLLNNSHYPLVISNACLTGNFQENNSFGESWLRSINGGAIGFIGATNETYWDEDLYWACGSFNHAGDGLTPSFEESGFGAYDIPFTSTDPITQASLITYGNLAVEESIVAGESVYLPSNYYWEVYTLLGDPSLLNYWGQPKEIIAQIPSVLNQDLMQIFIPIQNP